MRPRRTRRARSTATAHAGGNPHLWLDPGYAVRYVERIRDALVEVDPANAETYRANAATYIGEINALDTWAKGEIATIPAERRKLVTFHDAFPYLAEHYGLELVGVVLKSPGREPSAQEVAMLVTEMQAAPDPDGLRRAAVQRSHPGAGRARRRHPGEAPLQRRLRRPGQDATST